MVPTLARGDAGADAWPPGIVAGAGASAGAGAGVRARAATSVAGRSKSLPHHAHRDHSSPTRRLQFGQTRRSRVRQVGQMIHSSLMRRAQVALIGAGRAKEDRIRALREFGRGFGQRVAGRDHAAQARDLAVPVKRGAQRVEDKLREPLERKNVQPRIPGQRAGGEQLAFELKRRLLGREQDQRRACRRCRQGGADFGEAAKGLAAAGRPEEKTRLHALLFAQRRQIARQFIVKFWQELVGWQPRFLFLFGKVTLLFLPVGEIPIG